MHVLVVVSYTGGTQTPNRFAERIRSVRWGRRTATLGITTGADVPRKGCQVCHSRRHGEKGDAGPAVAESPVAKRMSLCRRPVLCRARRPVEVKGRVKAEYGMHRRCPDPCVSAAGSRPVRTLPAALGLAVVIQAVKGIVEYFWFQR